MRFSQISIKSRRIFSLSKYSSSADLGFCILKRVSHPSFSLGIVVTKKIGCAVIRNKIKRRIKHAFWEMSKQQALPPVAIVAIARKEAATVDFYQIIQKLGKYFIAG